METKYGPKYNKDLSRKQIAQAFRNDVKAAIAAGELPKGLKLSVRTREFSGGGSIDVEIKACPSTLFQHDLERGDGLCFTEQAIELRSKLRSMLNDYNFDGSDNMADYYHVRFYGDVRFSWG